MLPSNKKLILNLLKPSEVKLIIVGKEPYSGSVLEDNKLKYYADGIMFSSRNTKRTPSQLLTLKKVFLKLSGRSYWYPNDLSYLVNQGVLLMPVYWSVKKGIPNSNQNVNDYNFSIKVINKIVSINQIPVITLGSNAKRMVSNTNAKLVFNAQHPSIARFNKGKWNGYKVFKLAVSYLEDKIEWGKK